MKTLARLVLLSSLIVTGTGLASADMPGAHPYYVHALTDLRQARAHLDYHGANEQRDAEEEHAIRSIDEIIDVVKKAAIADGKDIKLAEPQDVRLARADRYYQALQLLIAARGDVAQKEDNPRARELKDHAFAQITDTIQIVKDLQRKYK
jgi:hypothetical protein